MNRDTFFPLILTMLEFRLSGTEKQQLHLCLLFLDNTPPLPAHTQMHARTHTQTNFLENLYKHSRSGVEQPEGNPLLNMFFKAYKKNNFV